MSRPNVIIIRPCMHISQWCCLNYYVNSIAESVCIHMHRVTYQIQTCNISDTCMYISALYEHAQRCMSATICGHSAIVLLNMTHSVNSTMKWIYMYICTHVCVYICTDIYAHNVLLSLFRQRTQDRHHDP